MSYYMHEYKFSFVLNHSSPRQPRRPQEFSSSLRHYTIDIRVHYCFLQHFPTDMSVLAISKETKGKIRAKADINEGRIKEAVKMLKEWLQTQPHLPHNYGKYCNWSLTLLGWILVYLKFGLGGGDYCNCKSVEDKKKNKFSLRLYCWRCRIHLQQQQYTLFILFCHICCFVVVITFS